MSKENKDLVVIGIDETQHKRIWNAMAKVKDPIKKHEFLKENLPKYHEDREMIVEYLKGQLEFHKEDETLSSFIQTNLDYYEKEYLDNLVKTEKDLEENEDNVKRSIEFMKYVEQFVKLEDNVITYDPQGVEMLLKVIDIFDLDDKHRHELLKKQQPR